MHPLKKGKEYRVEIFDNSSYIPGVDFGVEGGVAGGILGSIGTGIEGFNHDRKPEPSFRVNLQPLLFFKTLETDETGSAEMEFITSDLLSRYRIMAVAYNETGFGKAEERITVTKDLVIKESMPVFAVKGDIFNAGVLICNRKKETASVTAGAEPENIVISALFIIRLKVLLSSKFGKLPK